MDEAGRLDVVIHNAGHMAFGPSEAFTPEQFGEIYNVNAFDLSLMRQLHCCCCFAKPMYI